MARCAFIKPGGDRCEATAMKGYDHCYGHRPDLAEERKRNSSKGGKAGGRGRGGSGELTEIKDLLKTLTDRVLGREDAEPLEPGRAAIANQIVNTRLRAVELGRKIKEQDELEARLDALERANEAQPRPSLGSGQRGERSWGA